MKANNKYNNSAIKILLHRIRIGIFLIPFLTVYAPLAEFLYQNTSILVNAFLLLLIYFGHANHFRNFIID